MKCSCDVRKYQREDNYGVMLYFYIHHKYDRTDLIVNKLLHFRLSRLRTSGTLARMKMSWWGLRMSCAINSDFTKFGFDQTVSAFVMWFSGLSLAVCFLLGEIVHRRYSRQHKIKLNKFRIETASAHAK